MRYIRNISDDQNKSGDTDNIFRFNLLQGDDIFNFGDCPISINIANSSGYILSMVPEKEFGNSVLKLDFNDQSLKSLTPDNYLLEVEVKFPDGTTATFPTKGGMPFTVNSNLKNTAGHLVPTVTFDEVLNAVDKKIAVYMDTVKVGPAGPIGPTGVVDTAKDYTWTGANRFIQPVFGSLATQTDLFTSFATVANNMQTYAGYSFSGTDYIKDMPVAGYATILVQPKENSNNTGFISLVYSNIKLSIIGHVNMGVIAWEILANDETVVHKTGIENIDGVKRFMQPVYGSLATNADWFTSFSEVATNMTKYAGYTSSGSGYISDMPYPGYALINVQPFNGKNDTGIITLKYSNVPITIIGHVNSGVITWEFVANDANTVHNTGTETVAGNKNFTGNNNFSGATTLKTGNYGLRVTTTGIQKTSDGGTTWVNI